MSEYQYVELRAVDRPLDDKQLKFAESQSSRADVSRWALSCEYNYSSFRGDVDKLLRQGYDVYLQYTNYGDREIKLRLSHGLPCKKTVWSKYTAVENLNWAKDKKGSGGILTLRSYREEMEQLWGFDSYLDAAIEIREHLIGGDLRALYLLWLCAADDDFNDPEEIIEPPVPHGLADMPDGCYQLLPFFGLDPLLIEAAGDGTGTAPETSSVQQNIDHWIATTDNDKAKALLRDFLTKDAMGVKANLLAEIRDAQTFVTWPVTKTNRTLEQLFEHAKVLRLEENIKHDRKVAAKTKRAAAKAEKLRQERMKEMLANPQHWLQEAEALARARGTANCKAAAEVLVDLREAIGGAEGEKIARKHAAHLAKTFPTLNHLKLSLRKRHLLD